MNLISIISIGIGLFILLSVYLVVYNIEMISKDLPDRLSVMIYLKDTISDNEIAAISRALEKDTYIKEAKFISKKEGMKDLKEILKEDDYILEGLDENPLPDMFEIRLNHMTLDVQGVEQFLTRITQFKGVEEIEYGGDFLKSIYFLRNGLRILGITSIIIFTIAIFFVSYSTVKILFYRHKDEIEVYKLLGATKGFIKTPFLIEGALIGLMGGFFATISISMFISFIVDDFIRTIPFFSSLVIPTHVMYLIPLVGCLLGFSGAITALGILKYREG